MSGLFLLSDWFLVRGWRGGALFAFVLDTRLSSYLGLFIARFAIGVYKYGIGGVHDFKGLERERERVSEGKRDQIDCVHGEKRRMDGGISVYL